jgi:hypothetical protein
VLVPDLQHVVCEKVKEVPNIVIFVWDGRWFGKQSNGHTISCLRHGVSGLGPWLLMILLVFLALSHLSVDPTTKHMRVDNLCFLLPLTS